MGDLDKIRAAVKRWAPRVSPVAIGAGAVAAGTVVGATLIMLAVRALAAAGASKGDLVIAVAGVVAAASANTLVWWFWGRDQAAKVREARRIASDWLRVAAERAVRLAALQVENERLAAEVEQLRRAEVAYLPHKRKGDQS